MSPGRRAWLRFRANRRGYWSLWIFLVAFVLCLGAEFLSNDKPIVIRYEG
jgi:microcin C transport system permease protein